jgi:uncharacterized repeat protein (TIGR03843 family)
LPIDEATTLDDAEVETILCQGSLELEGRLATASNASFLGEVSLDGTTLRCIYKPVRGERPLWDFPDGTLAGRERAARLVSEAGGWNVVPPTVLRDGRFGPGMCQRWVDVDVDLALVDVVSADFDEDGWLAVLEAEDHTGYPVLLVHRDDDRLRDMAVLDVVINNADRKGGHVLPESDDLLWGCDHGVSFHEDPKLRTVLWGWGGDDVRERDVHNLRRLLSALDAGLEGQLMEYLARSELSALRKRVGSLLRTARMPVPRGSWPAIPWPPF